MSKNRYSFTEYNILLQTVQRLLKKVLDKSHPKVNCHFVWKDLGTFPFCCPWRCLLVGGRGSHLFTAPLSHSYQVGSGVKQSSNFVQVLLHRHRVKCFSLCIWQCIFPFESEVNPYGHKTRMQQEHFCCSGQNTLNWCWYLPKPDGRGGTDRLSWFSPTAPLLI